MSVPNRLIFIWFGNRFPYACKLALRSARKQCRPDEILFLAGNPEAMVSSQIDGLDDIAAWPELKVEKADGRWFEGLPEGGDLARELYARSASPASKANLLRLAILYQVGGIYLDCDTITVRDLSPLRDLRGFAGMETVVFPAQFRKWKNPGKWPLAGARLGMREVLARMPSGWRGFRFLERFYFQAANNAVLGAEAGHPFLAECFAALGSIPEKDRLRRFRLGTHLLQEMTENRSRDDFTLLPSGHFFPLGPEISNHWFFPGTARQVSELLRSETSVVHWYNSVEHRFLKQEITPAWVAEHLDTGFSELVRRYC